ncbi:MAG TPA: DUF2946 family protein [Caulobacteraceae bacterium]|nr:DUF2946 family protein [Caulobacteraceae bacterium]
MMRACRSLVAARDGFTALAALALVMQVLVPQGFMFSGNPSSPGLVICTGHGPLVLSGDHGQPGKAPRPSQDRPCGFAAHGAASEPPTALSASAIAFYAAATEAAPAHVVAPGRGLAAPPPPSRAPPILT